jgi:signal transduction histidine kinase
VDPQRITQAALQLASNAVRHTDDEDAIALGTRLDEHRLLLWVRDTGTGVATDLNGDIFERFTQDNGASQGSGLGLAIVRAIVEAHSGNVCVDSAPGRGATFTMTIPTERAATPW